MSQDEIDRLLRSNHGVITRAQAHKAGLTDRQISRRLGNGYWLHLFRGVYRHAAVSPTWHSEMLAACVATGGVASHRAAAFLHQLDGFRACRREVVVPRGRWSQHESITVHQTIQMLTSEHVRLRRIPVTGLARTILDLGAVVSPARVGDSVDEVVRTGRLDFADLYEVVMRDSACGRDGCGVLRAELDDRSGPGEVPLSSWSRMFVNMLTDAGIQEPTCEHRILGVKGELIAQVDLAYPRHKVLIELDSVRWHMNRESFERDRRRWNRLMLEGWSVLIFSWSDFVDHTSRVVGDVRAALAAINPPLHAA